MRGMREIEGDERERGRKGRAKGDERKLIMRNMTHCRSRTIAG